jgi:hypothetical protein
VYGIADIITCDRILGIAGIVCLPTCSWYPDDTCKTILTNLVNDRLEEIVQCLGIVLIAGIFYIDRLIG